MNVDENRVEAELTQVRARLRDTAWGYPTTGTRPFVGLLVATIVLGGVAGLGLLLAVLAFATGAPGVGAFFLVVGTAFAVPGVVLLRKVVVRQRPVNAERAALLRRESELVAGLRQVESGTPVPPALRPDRQPSPYAQMMWARFPVGPSPEDALRRLPADAPAWRVTFHRKVGWGLVVAIAVAVSGLVGYAVLTASR